MKGQLKLIVDIEGDGLKPCIEFTGVGMTYGDAGAVWGAAIAVLSMAAQRHMETSSDWRQKADFIEGKVRGAKYLRGAEPEVDYASVQTPIDPPESKPD